MEEKSSCLARSSIAGSAGGHGIPWRKLVSLSIAMSILVVPFAQGATKPGETAGKEPAPSTIRPISSRPAHLLRPAPAGLAAAAVENGEPIATIGHGGFFGPDGRQIVPTAEFVAKAQSWYRERLLAGLKPKQRAAFFALEQRLGKGLDLTGQAGLVVRQRALDWLIAQSPRTLTDRMHGKLNALKYRLNWQLPLRDDLKALYSLESFKLDPAVEARLRLAEFTPPITKTATTNSGAAYIAECTAAGVPIPPSIGDMSPGNWTSLGFIPQLEQFIVGTPAEFRVYQDANGMCVALPRYTDNTQTTVLLDGVICLSQTTSKVCFWDNQMSGSSFTFPAGTQIPIGVPNATVDPSLRYQAGGAELVASVGGMCTNCHAGENPYIIHPNADLGGGLLMGDLDNAPLNLPTFGPNRYDPIVLGSWAQNSLSQALDVPSACIGCHNTVGGPAGRFPHLSSSLGDYCTTILDQAINNTMPPGSPGSEVGTVEVNDFVAWCGVPATSGPSNRGDPHLTTTNGINYDFQAAGEFTALRNSATGFELQTRQTPVLTTFTPGPNPYTGLASCVSLNTAAALRVGRSRISYQPSPGTPGRPEQMELRIDGKLVTLPTSGSLNLGGGNRIARAAAGGGIDVRAADGTRVIITPNYWSSQGYWYLDVEVLNTPAREGTMGHIRSSEWLPRGPGSTSFGPAPGTLAARHALLNGTFANAWRVSSTTSLFDYAPGTSTASFTNVNWPPPPGTACTSISGGFPWPGVETRLPVKPMNPQDAERLCAPVADLDARTNCVFDVTITGNAAMANGYLTTLYLRTTP